LPLRPELIKYCVPTTQGGYTALMDLLGQYPEITAVFAYNDLTATGVLQACAVLNRHVPADMEIIGVDDIPLASLVSPALSTVSIDKQELGAATMRTLVQLLNGEYSSAHYQQTIESKLVLRGTTTII